MNNKKEVHSVEMKNKIQEDIAKEVQGMSPEQELEYFQQEPKDSTLRAWWNEVKKQQPKQSKKASD